MTEYAQPTSMEEWETFQPYAMWARGRETDQVIRFDGYVADDQPSFHVTRYADAERVLRDWETFSSSINGEIIGRYMGDLILAMNGKEHRQYRNLVAHAFRASVLDRWDAQLVRPVIDELLDEVAPLGRADLVASVTSRYPVQVICGIVGVPLEDHAQFARWAEEINMGPLHPERGMAASVGMRDYLAPLVAARRVEPTGDLLRELVHAEVDGAASHRREDLRLPPAAVAGRSGDDVPGDGQRARTRCSPIPPTSSVSSPIPTGCSRRSSRRPCGGRRR